MLKFLLVIVVVLLIIMIFKRFIRK